MDDREKARLAIEMARAAIENVLRDEVAKKGDVIFGAFVRVGRNIFTGTEGRVPEGGREAFMNLVEMLSSAESIHTEKVKGELQ